MVRLSFRTCSKAAPFVSSRASALPLARDRDPTRLATVCVAASGVEEAAMESSRSSSEMSVGGSLVRLAREAGGVRRASEAVRKPAVVDGEHKRSVWGFVSCSSVTGWRVQRDALRPLSTRAAGLCRALLVSKGCLRAAAASLYRPLPLHLPNPLCKKRARLTFGEIALPLAGEGQLLELDVLHPLACRPTRFL